MFDVGLAVVQKIREIQSENIDKAGKLVAAAPMEGHKFFVTGSGDSHMVTEEFYGRAGGLAFPV